MGGMREEEPSCCCECGTGGANMPDGGNGAETGGCGRGNVGRVKGGRFKDNLLEVLGAEPGVGLGHERGNDDIGAALLTIVLAELYGEM